jgi:succinate-semialdehyde dehydrogenase / glutarate-semialdehyde dehydrogenase
MSTIQPPDQSLDPATGEVVAKFETATDDQVAAALAAADEAYRTWRDEPLETRLEVVRTIGPPVARTGRRSRRSGAAADG